MLTAVEAWVCIRLLKKRARALRSEILMARAAPYLTQQQLDWQDELDGICDLLAIVDKEWVDTIRLDPQP